MFSIIFTWLIVAWGALACIYMLHCAWSRFPKRDADDVIPFLYPVDISLAESLLDPAAEFESRWKLGPLQFREAQRKRMRLFLEVTRRMAHNAKVLVEYADAEKKSHDPRRVGLASALQEIAIGVRLYSLLTGIKLRFRSECQSPRGIRRRGKEEPRSSPRRPGFRAARDSNRSPPLFPADRNQASFLATASRGYL